MNETLLQLKKNYPYSYDYIVDNLVYNDDKTQCRRCFRCKNPILFETHVGGYPYQCIVCDENLFTNETFWGDLPTEMELCELIETVADILLLDIDE